MNSEVGMDKLRTYKMIKHKFELKKYLEILQDRKQRKSITAFRISAHKLQIERGRYISRKQLRTNYALLVIILKMRSIFFVNVLSISHLVQKCM